MIAQGLTIVKKIKTQCFERRKVNTMKIQEPRTETVKSTLADLLMSGNDTNLRPYRVLIGHNMGFSTLVMSVPIDKFYDISEVANERNIEEKGAYEGQQVAQRELDPKHAERLATYIMKGLFASVEAKAKLRGSELSEEFYTMKEALGPQPYLALQPITANIRSCDFGGSGLRVEQTTDGTVTVYLAPQHVLWVIDGQHRREAMRLLFEFLKEVTTTLKYPRRALYPGAESGDPVSAADVQVWNLILEAWRSGCTVMVEIHLGLNAKQERQLFHDLNNLTKKVAPSLAFTFDDSNPVNVFVKRQLIEADGAIFKDKIVERDNTPWNEDKGVITRKDLMAINAMLFLNKSNARGAIPHSVVNNLDYALQFWGAVAKIPGFAATQAKLKTVAAQPVLLKSLAKLAYTFGLGREEDGRSLRKLLDGIPTIDYRHTNPMWRINRLQDQDRQRLCPGLTDYLPSGFVEVGSFDEQQQLFRFSPLHNDVIPAIGDMIRWTLKLPNRFADRGSESVRENGIRENGIRELDPEAPGNLSYTRILEGNFGATRISNWNHLLQSAVGTSSQKGLGFPVLAEIAAVRDRDPDRPNWHRVGGTNLWVNGMMADHCWQKSLRLAQSTDTDIRVLLEWEETEGAAHPGEKAVLRWSPSHGS